MYTIEIVTKKEVRHGLTLTRGMLYARGGGMNYAAKYPHGESFEVFMRNIEKGNWHKAEVSIHYSSLARELLEFAYSHREILAALTRKN